jgi:anti-anti-sigma factor
MAGSLYDLTERKLAEERLREKLAIIERQQEAIRTLSTPIIEVWDGTLTMPVFGTIDSERAQYMMSVLLDVITRTRSRYAIVDLTGVDHIDKATANHVVNLIRAVQLLGARGIVVGIKPDVARTLVSIGVDLSDIITLANLREALVRCMQEPVH